jgi:hypothetical protein
MNLNTWIRGWGEQEPERKCTQNSGRERRYWGERGDKAAQSSTVSKITILHVGKKGRPKAQPGNQGGTQSIVCSKREESVNRGRNSPFRVVM